MPEEKFKIKNSGIKNHSVIQKYFYLIISLFFLFFLIYFTIKAFLFLKKSFDVTFNFPRRNEWVHFNKDGLKEISNKINCSIK